MTFDNDMMFAHYDLLGLLLVFALLLVNPFFPSCLAKNLTQIKWDVIF